MLVTLGAQTPPPEDLSAAVRISELTTSHNSFPDDCGMRLQRLYIAEDLQMLIQVQFSRQLTDDESHEVQWEVTGGAAEPASGDFADLPNPASITTLVKAPSSDNEVVMRLTYDGTDLVDPLPIRVVTDADYNAAYAALNGYVNRTARGGSELPLTSDLLARFLG